MQGDLIIQLHGLFLALGSVIGAQPLADPAVALTISAAFLKTKQARITYVTTVSLTLLLLLLIGPSQLLCAVQGKLRFHSTCIMCACVPGVVGTGRNLEYNEGIVIVMANKNCVSNN